MFGFILYTVFACQCVLLVGGLALVGSDPGPLSWVFAVECFLVLCGLILEWKLVLSPAARQQRSIRLPIWDVTFTDFLMLLWLVVTSGMVGQFAVNLWHKFHPLDKATLTIVATLVFQISMLLGMLIHRVALSRPSSRLPFVLTGAARSGVATFLVALPVVTVIGLIWQTLLDLCGVKPELQEAVDLLRFTDSVALRLMLLAVAILVAPITEELIFRAGLFRYLRTRWPRWAALLVPAVLFAVLHLNLGSFVPLVALAIVFSLAYERTGNIGTTIVAHALFNLNASMLVLAGVNL